MTFEQAALNPDNQLFRTVAVLDVGRRLRVENRAHARIGQHTLAGGLDHLLTTDRHLNQREGIQYHWLDGDFPAIAHASDTYATQAPVIDAGVDRALGAQVTQPVLAKDAFAPFPSLIEIRRTAQLEAGQDCIGRYYGWKGKTLHKATSSALAHRRAGTRTSDSY
ncbi:hypothetical protein D3C85_1142080 [compost metagenome]